MIRFVGLLGIKFSPQTPHGITSSIYQPPGSVRIRFGELLGL